MAPSLAKVTEPAWGQSEQDCDHDSVQVELQSRWERQGFCGKGGCAGRSQVETKTFVVHLASESLSNAMEDP